MAHPARKNVSEYDCVVIGAGPAGLTAAMNLGFEGRKALLIDGRNQPGGQAGTSHFIENLPGFPKGIDGPTFTAAMVEHAAKFHVDFQMPFRAVRAERNDNGTFVIFGEDHSQICCKAIVLALGASQRLLPATNASRYLGRGVSYGSPMIAKGLWENKRVGVVGGANSAAQATMFLSQCVGCHVTMFVRDPDLEKGMSWHVHEFFKEPHENIKIVTGVNVQEVLGNECCVTGVKLKGKDEIQQIDLDHLFVQIGASPPTGFLQGFVEMDARGYIYTGRDLPTGAWKLPDRKPLGCETSQPGVFACGDVRLGNFRKRASTAAGDGAIVAASVFDYLLMPVEQVAKAAAAA